MNETSGKEEGEPPLAADPSERTLKHLIVFQLKLAADAMRDFLLSPLSVVAYLFDLLRGADAQSSLYLRLMRLGRHSDRIINLFDAHSEEEDFTLDRAVNEVEDLLRSRKEPTDRERGP